MDFRSALLDAFVEYVVPILATGLMALVGWAVKALAEKLQAQAHGSKVSAVLYQLTAFVELVVVDLNNTLKPKLLEASKDGRITAVEAKALKDDAMARVKLLLGQHGLDKLQDVLGVLAPQVDSFISGLIEKSVAAQPAVVGRSSDPQSRIVTPPDRPAAMVPA